MSALHISPVRHSGQAQGSKTLRHAVLRAPWGRILEPDTAPPADDLVGELDDRVVVTGRLYVSADGRHARIRGMAVAPEYQGRGFGKDMLRALEIRARGRGCNDIELNARTSALAFYLDAGYTDRGEGPTLFDSIPHRLVGKRIAHDVYAPWGLQLRPAHDSDGPALQALIFGALAEFGMQPEHDGIDRDLEALESTYAGGAFWVATNAQDQPVASVGMLKLPTPGHFELRRMYLAADFRGRNLGRALLGTAMNWAFAQQATYVELETASVLERARHLYDWAGFATVSGELETRRCDQRMGMQIPAPDTTSG